jgi:ATP-dependent Clp protease ATP-binding subunit ClpX
MIGYSSDKDKEKIDKDRILQYISPSDIKKYGLIPEIVGRLPVLSYLNPLEKDTLKLILTEPKNSLVKQFVKLFEMDDIKLSFDDNVLDFIVDKSIEFKLGARGLRSIVEAILTDAMFELPSQKSVKSLKVSLAYAKQKFDKANLSKLKVA